VAPVTVNEIGDRYRAECRNQNDRKLRMIKAAVVGLGWWGQNAVERI
jgi:hypothetical protein